MYVRVIYQILLKFPLLQESDLDAIVMKDQFTRIALASRTIIYSIGAVPYFIDHEGEQKCLRRKKSEENESERNERTKKIKRNEKEKKNNEKDDKNKDENEKKRENERKKNENENEMDEKMKM